MEEKFKVYYDDEEDIKTITRLAEIILKNRVIYIHQKPHDIKEIIYSEDFASDYNTNIFSEEIDKLTDKKLQEDYKRVFKHCTTRIEYTELELKSADPFIVPEYLIEELSLWKIQNGEFKSIVETEQIVGQKNLLLFMNLMELVEKSTITKQMKTAAFTLGNRVENYIYLNIYKLYGRLIDHTKAPKSTVYISGVVSMNYYKGTIMGENLRILTFGDVHRIERECESMKYEEVLLPGDILRPRPYGISVIPFTPISKRGDLFPPQIVKDNPDVYFDFFVEGGTVFHKTLKDVLSEERKGTDYKLLYDVDPIKYIEKGLARLTVIENMHKYLCITSPSWEEKKCPWKNVRFHYMNVRNYEEIYLWFKYTVGVENMFAKGLVSKFIDIIFKKDLNSINEFPIEPIRKIYIEFIHLFFNNHFASFYREEEKKENVFDTLVEHYTNLISNYILSDNPKSSIVKEYKKWDIPLSERKILVKSISHDIAKWLLSLETTRLLKEKTEKWIGTTSEIVETDLQFDIITFIRRFIHILMEMYSVGRILKLFSNLDHPRALNIIYYAGEHHVQLLNNILENTNLKFEKTIQCDIEGTVLKDPSCLNIAKAYNLVDGELKFIPFSE